MKYDWRFLSLAIVLLLQLEHGWTIHVYQNNEYEVSDIDKRLDIPHPAVKDSRLHRHHHGHHGHGLKRHHVTTVLDTPTAPNGGLLFRRQEVPVPEELITSHHHHHHNHHRDTRGFKHPQKPHAEPGKKNELVFALPIEPSSEVRYKKSDIPTSAAYKKSNVAPEEGDRDVSASEKEVARHEIGFADDLESLTDLVRKAERNIEQSRSVIAAGQHPGQKRQEIIHALDEGKAKVEPEDDIEALGRRMDETGNEIKDAKYEQTPITDKHAAAATRYIISKIQEIQDKLFKRTGNKELEDKLNQMAQGEKSKKKESAAITLIQNTTTVAAAPTNSSPIVNNTNIASKDKTQTAERRKIIPEEVVDKILEKFQQLKKEAKHMAVSKSRHSVEHAAPLPAPQIIEWRKAPPRSTTHSLPTSGNPCSRHGFNHTTFRTRRLLRSYSDDQDDQARVRHSVRRSSQSYVPKKVGNATSGTKRSMTVLSNAHAILSLKSGVAENQFMDGMSLINNQPPPLIDDAREESFSRLQEGLIADPMAEFNIRAGVALPDLPPTLDVFNGMEQKTVQVQKEKNEKQKNEKVKKASKKEKDESKGMYGDNMLPDPFDIPSNNRIKSMTKSFTNQWDKIDDQLNGIKTSFDTQIDGQMKSPFTSQTINTENTDNTDGTDNTYGNDNTYGSNSWTNDVSNVKSSFANQEGSKDASTNHIDMGDDVGAAAEFFANEEKALLQNIPGLKLRPHSKKINADYDADQSSKRSASGQSQRSNDNVMFETGVEYNAQSPIMFNNRKFLGNEVELSVKRHHLPLQKSQSPRRSRSRIPQPPDAARRRSLAMSKWHPNNQINHQFVKKWGTPRRVPLRIPLAAKGTQRNSVNKLKSKPRLFINNRRNPPAPKSRMIVRGRIHIPFSIQGTQRNTMGRPKPKARLPLINHEISKLPRRGPVRNPFPVTGSRRNLIGMPRTNQRLPVRRPRPPIQKSYIPKHFSLSNWPNSVATKRNSLEQYRNWHRIPLNRQRVPFQKSKIPRRNSFHVALPYNAMPRNTLASNRNAYHPVGRRNPAMMKPNLLRRASIHIAPPFKVARTDPFGLSRRNPRIPSNRQWLATQRLRKPRPPARFYQPQARKNSFPVLPRRRIIPFNRQQSPIQKSKIPKRNPIRVAMPLRAARRNLLGLFKKKPRLPRVPIQKSRIPISKHALAPFKAARRNLLGLFGNKPRMPNSHQHLPIQKWKIPRRAPFRITRPFQGGKRSSIVLLRNRQRNPINQQRRTPINRQHIPMQKSIIPRRTPSRNMIHFRGIKRNSISLGRRNPRVPINHNLRPILKSNIPKRIPPRDTTPSLRNSFGISLPELLDFDHEVDLNPPAAANMSPKLRKSLYTRGLGSYVLAHHATPIYTLKDLDKLDRASKKPFDVSESEEEVSEDLLNENSNNDDDSLDGLPENASQTTQQYKPKMVAEDRAVDRSHLGRVAAPRRRTVYGRLTHPTPNSRNAGRSAMIAANMIRTALQTELGINNPVIVPSQDPFRYVEKNLKESDIRTRHQRPILPKQYQPAILR